MNCCRHCHKSKVNRPRGLCWSCYYKPGVRDKYPSTSKYARRGHGNITGTPPEPVRATDAEPGSEEKIRVLAERVRRRESLWHPEDARVETPAAAAAAALAEAAKPRREEPVAATAAA